MNWMKQLTFLQMWCTTLTLMLTIPLEWKVPDYTKKVSNTVFMCGMYKPHFFDKNLPSKFGVRLIHVFFLKEKLDPLKKTLIL
jgi:hypothetical protein